MPFSISLAWPTYSKVWWPTSSWGRGRACSFQGQDRELLFRGRGKSEKLLVWGDRSQYHSITILGMIVSIVWVSSFFNNFDSLGGLCCFGGLWLSLERSPVQCYCLCLQLEPELSEARALFFSNLPAILHHLIATMLEAKNPSSKWRPSSYTIQCAHRSHIATQCWLKFVAGVRDPLVPFCARSVWD